MPNILVESPPHQEVWQWQTPNSVITFNCLQESSNFKIIFWIFRLSFHRRDKPQKMGYVSYYYMDFPAHCHYSLRHHSLGGIIWCEARWLEWSDSCEESGWRHGLLGGGTLCIEFSFQASLLAGTRSEVVPVSHCLTIRPTPWTPQYESTTTDPPQLSMEKWEDHHLLLSPKSWDSKSGPESPASWSYIATLSFQHQGNLFIPPPTCLVKPF